MRRSCATRLVGNTVSRRAASAAAVSPWLRKLYEWVERGVMLGGGDRRSGDERSGLRWVVSRRNLCTHQPACSHHAVWASPIMYQLCHAVWGRHKETGWDMSGTVPGSWPALSMGWSNAPMARLDVGKGRCCSRHLASSGTMVLKRSQRSPSVCLGNAVQVRASVVMALSCRAAARVSMLCRVLLVVCSTPWRHLRREQQ